MSICIAYGSINSKPEAWNTSAPEVRGVIFPLARTGSMQLAHLFLLHSSMTCIGLVQDNADLLFLQVTSTPRLCVVKLQEDSTRAHRTSAHCLGLTYVKSLSQSQAVDAKAGHLNESQALNSGETTSPLSSDEHTSTQPRATSGSTAQGTSDSNGSSLIARPR
jgi:hypothetical protein